MSTCFISDLAIIAREQKQFTSFLACDSIYAERAICTDGHVGFISCPNFAAGLLHHHVLGFASAKLFCLACYTYILGNKRTQAHCYFQFFMFRLNYDFS